jgi:hypothetical protein
VVGDLVAAQELETVEEELPVERDDRLRVRRPIDRPTDEGRVSSSLGRI